jgi:hypothetical protein
MARLEVTNGVLSLEIQPSSIANYILLIQLRSKGIVPAETAGYYS